MYIVLDLQNEDIRGSCGKGGIKLFFCLSAEKSEN